VETNARKPKGFKGENDTVLWGSKLRVDEMKPLKPALDPCESELKKRPYSIEGTKKKKKRPR